MKNTLQRILDYTGSLFDVVGVTKYEGYGTLVIVGLESTAERNLDEFGRTNGENKLSGFEKHMSPLLDTAVSFIRDQSYTAEPVGRYGYPPQGRLNLKELAIRTGIGKRGKHSVVLHDKYGTCLRFAALKIEGSLQSQAKPALKDTGNPLCRHCSLCIEACPVKIIAPYRVTNTSECLSRVEMMREQSGQLVPCDECLKVCPVGIN